MSDPDCGNFGWCEAGTVNGVPGPLPTPQPDQAAARGCYVLSPAGQDPGTGAHEGRSCSAWRHD
jgi:hypothetical protein